MTSSQIISSKAHSSLECNPNPRLTREYDNDVANHVESISNSEHLLGEKVSTNLDKRTSRDPANIFTKGVSSQQAKTNSQTSTLHPFVFWSQTDTHISVRVDLLQAKDVNVAIRESVVENCESVSGSKSGNILVFSAKGKGAQGLQEYQFELNFFSQVENKPLCHIIERYVLILLTKSDSSIQWKRLTRESVKHPWLRFDFDRYAESDEDEDSEVDALVRDRKQYQQLRESLDKNSLKQQLDSSQATSTTFSKDSKKDSWSQKLDNILYQNNRDTKDIFNPFKKRLNRLDNSANMKYDYRKDNVATDSSRNTAKNALDIKKTYLFLYNVIMFIMFLKVSIVLLIKGLSGTVDDDIVEGAAFIIKILTYTQLLETIHPILGLVPGGPLMPFTQVVGRLLVNQFLTDPTIRINSAPYAQYLFMVWSSIEIFRYSFYALRVFKVNIYFLTWCRYTLFLPLYPMGGFCESMVIFSTIKQFEKTNAYSINLPNRLNISFKPTLAMQIYVYLILFPTIYSLMRYMWRQRCKQLSKDKEA